MTMAERDDQDLRDLKSLVETPVGRRVLSLVFEMCGAWRLSYQGEETHATAFKEGARNVALGLMGKLDQALDQTGEDWRGKIALADRERSVEGWKQA